jgi:hypothetical protein
VPEVKPALQKILYDRKSAAEALSISTRSLDYQAAARLINFVKKGNKVMYRHEELLRWSRINQPNLSEASEPEDEQEAA